MAITQTTFESSKVAEESVAYFHNTPCELGTELLQASSRITRMYIFRNELGEEEMAVTLTQFRRHFPDLNCLHVSHDIAVWLGTPNRRERSERQEAAMELTTDERNPYEYWQTSDPGYCPHEVGNIEQADEELQEMHRKLMEREEIYRINDLHKLVSVWEDGDIHPDLRNGIQQTVSETAYRIVG